MKALVIGASGQVGGALVAALERAGESVVGMRRAQLDVCDKASVSAAFASARPEVVFLAVNTAGGVDRCEAQPKEAQALNVEGTRNVAAAVRRAGAKLVYYSTDYVFDGKAGPYGEDDAACPLNAYGRSKLEAERLVESLLPGKALVLRTTAVFGWDRASKNFAMQIWESLSAGKTMKVPSDQWCNPTLVDYLAEASIRLVQLGACGRVNVVGKTRMTRSELARKIAQALALDASLLKPTPTARLQARAARPLEGGLKTGKLQALLGTEPWAIEESLNRFRRKWRIDTHVKPAAPSTKAEALKAEILEKTRQYCELVHTPAPFVPGKSRVPYAGRVFGAPELTRLVDSALDFWLTLGPYGDVFERQMRDYFGARDFLAVNSGSTANLTAVMTLMSERLERPLKAGDEVLTPAVTFPTTLTPLVHGGLVPVLVDCELGTYNVDPKLLEKAVSKRTRAIMVPHTLGNPCDMEIIVDLARRKDLRLIEDSCDALGSKFAGRLVGTFGELATLSFYPAHHITMGEGGGVIVNDPRLGRVARSVRDWGRDCWCAPGESNTCGKRFGWQLGGLPKGYDHKYTYSNLGYNFKPTDLQAAIGTAQAERIPDFVARRRANFQALYEGLSKYSDRLILPRVDPRAEPSWFAFPITVGEGVSRRELVHRLENANIETRELFGGNILKQPGYLNIKARVAGKLANSDRVMRDTFFIGVYPGLTPEMVSYVLKTFDGFFGGRA